MSADRLLDSELLGEFAELLTERAPDVAARLRPGVSEEEILARFDSVGVTASKDAVTWWQFWDGPPPLDREGLSREAYLDAVSEVHSEILPGFQFLSLDVCVRGVETNRETARQILGGMPDDFDLDDHWPLTWIPLFVDGGGFQFALDCQHPDRPSALRICFREDFSGPRWGEILCSSMAGWLMNGTEWMRRERGRYDAEQRSWVPRSAFDHAWPRFGPK